MSIDYSIHLAVGFVVPEAVIWQVFGKRKDEVFHMETRFDQKTGEKLPETKVVDEPMTTTLYYDGEEFVESMDLVDYLCGQFDAVFWFDCAGASEEKFYVIGPSFATEKNRELSPQITAGGMADLSSLVGPDLQSEIERLKRQLVTLKLVLPRAQAKVGLAAEVF